MPAIRGAWRHREFAIAPLLLRSRATPGIHGWAAPDGPPSPEQAHRLEYATRCQFGSGESSIGS